jgi:hypothetical protein
MPAATALCDQEVATKRRGQPLRRKMTGAIQTWIMGEKQAAQGVPGAFTNEPTMVILPLERSSGAHGRLVEIVNEAAKAKDIKSGETVLDRGNLFIITEVRVPEHGLIAFVDTAGVRHGVYQPDKDFRSRGLSTSRVVNCSERL